jgi:ribosomal protein S10
LANAPAGILLLTRKSPEAAAAAATELFEAARQYTRAIALNSTQTNIVSAIVNSEFYNITQQVRAQPV